MDNLTYIYLAGGLILSIWVIILTLLYLKSVRHYKRLVKSSEGKDLAQILDTHFGEINKLNNLAEVLREDIQNLERADLKHIQRVGLVRFNPYGDTGGNQSFVLSLLDNQGNGLVISSLHGRESTRVYCKPIVNWSEGGFEFSEEEKQAVEKAKNNAGY